LKRPCQTGEPTGNPGQFGSINRTESPVGLAEAPLSEVEVHIKEVPEETGLAGVMPGILEMLHAAE